MLTAVVLMQGTGEFTMEDNEHLPISQGVQMQLVNSHKARKGTEQPGIPLSLILSNLPSEKSKIFFSNSF